MSSSLDASYIRPRIHASHLASVYNEARRPLMCSKAPPRTLRMTVWYHPFSQVRKSGRRGALPWMQGAEPSLRDADWRCSPNDTGTWATRHANASCATFGHHVSIGISMEASCEGVLRALARSGRCGCASSVSWVNFVDESRVGRNLGL